MVCFALPCIPLFSTWLESTSLLTSDALDKAKVLIRQPKPQPISNEQLVAEVKGIYAMLVMVESKCTEVDNAQSSSKLNNEQWQALIALHRTLLHENHDFFLPSQHPSASPTMRRLASKYAMLAKVRRHRTHSFLKLLRHRLPSSLKLLNESVPAFEDKWMECLGDFGRYRHVGRLADDDMPNGESWTVVARHRCTKSSDQVPATGRLFHHLAILARSKALHQLFYYVKNLCLSVPYVDLSARESIMTLFDPLLATQAMHRPATDATYVRAHKILFSGHDRDRFDESVAASSHPPDCLRDALNLASRTHDIILRRFGGDLNILPYLHVTLTFMMSPIRDRAAHLKGQVPWKAVSLMLKNILANCSPTLTPPAPTLVSEPATESPVRPLPEDWAMHGLIFREKYFPSDWFAGD
ncbi:hypothetical protein QBC33DRAFT_460524, partial [Phialemonium atrogriseum]